MEVFTPLAIAALSASISMTSLGDRPLALHPQNPHYLSYRGKPTLLITSGEHYGAVLNLDFDFKTYLSTLQKDGMNLTRMFSGAYVENPNEFNIRRNTLAPLKERFNCPWARSAEPGYPNGGTKFDLARWDEAYFKRLKDFTREAERRDVCVEVVLFCPFYNDALWHIDPMNAANNVNGVGNCPSNEVYTLKHADLTRVQEELTRKMVRELNSFPNIYFEICNEPYFGGVTLEWQRHISSIIADTETRLPNKHLIAQNIANDWAKIENPDPRVSIFNFHYASPPRAVTENYGLNKPISFDETGFKGTADFTYRAQAWEFILAGGAIFDNLDYSFSALHPDGTDPVADPTPGGGSPALRRLLRVLHDFLRKFNFAKMAPSDVAHVEPPTAHATVLAGPGRQYAIYLRGRADGLTLRVPDGNYRALWVDTLTGAVISSQDIQSSVGAVPTLKPPLYTEDVALRITRR